MSYSTVDLLLPPASLGVLALLALMLPGWRGRAVAAVPLLSLVILSMPLVGTLLLVSLDDAAVPPGPAPQAIVILSADVERAAGGPADVGPLTLERERAGAALARRTGLPVLVTGGLVTAPPPVAEMMAASLQADFGVSARWVENRSATTWENAQFSAPLLKADGIERVFVVTHAWHMRRALLAFERAGLVAVPAPVRHEAGPRWSAGEFIPRASAWMRSYLALHEWAGWVQYRVRA